MVFQIPLAKIVLIPRETLYEGRVKLYYTAMDEDGGIAEVQQDLISIQIPSSDLAGALEQYYAYEARLLIAPGRHIFGAGIRDEYGGSASFVSKGVLAGRG